MINHFIGVSHLLHTSIISLFCTRNVFWNETGNLVCLATEDSYFILKVDTGAIATAIETKSGVGEDGLEEAFDVSDFHCKSMLIVFKQK